MENMKIVVQRTSDIAKGFNNNLPENVKGYLAIVGAKSILSKAITKYFSIYRYGINSIDMANRMIEYIELDKIYKNIDFNTLASLLRNEFDKVLYLVGLTNAYKVKDSSDHFIKSIEDQIIACIYLLERVDAE